MTVVSGWSFVLSRVGITVSATSAKAVLVSSNILSVHPFLFICCTSCTLKICFQNMLENCSSVIYFLNCCFSVTLLRSFFIEYPVFLYSYACPLNLIAFCTFLFIYIGLFQELLLALLEYLPEAQLNLSLNNFNFLSVAFLLLLYPCLCFCHISSTCTQCAVLKFSIFIYPCSSLFIYGYKHNCITGVSESYLMFVSAMGFSGFKPNSLSQKVPCGITTNIQVPPLVSTCLVAEVGFRFFFLGSSLPVLSCFLLCENSCYKLKFFCKTQNKTCVYIFLRTLFFSHCSRSSYRSVNVLKKHQWTGLLVEEVKRWLLSCLRLKVLPPGTDENGKRGSSGGEQRSRLGVAQVYPLRRECPGCSPEMLVLSWLGCLLPVTTRAYLKSTYLLPSFSVSVASLASLFILLCSF